MRYCFHHEQKVVTNRLPGPPYQVELPDGLPCGTSVVVNVSDRLVCCLSELIIRLADERALTVLFSVRLPSNLQCVELASLGASKRVNCDVSRFAEAMSLEIVCLHAGFSVYLRGAREQEYFFWPHRTLPDKAKLLTVTGNVQLAYVSVAYGDSVVVSASTD